MAKITLPKPVFPTLNDTLTSGITKSDNTLPISTLVAQYSADNITYRSVFDVNTLVKNIAADAAEGFGEHIASFPVGWIRPIGGAVKLTSLCPTGLSATAGEVGLGTTIATGAVSVLGGTAAFENIMEGTTLSNHVAATTLTSRKQNTAIAWDAHNAAPATGGQLLDGSSTAAKIHLNLASTWNQTAAENVTFSARVWVDWVFVTSGSE